MNDQDLTAIRERAERAGKVEDFLGHRGPIQLRAALNDLPALLEEIERREKSIETGDMLLSACQQGNRLLDAENARLRAVVEAARQVREFIRRGWDVQDRAFEQSDPLGDLDKALSALDEDK